MTTFIDLLKPIFDRKNLDFNKARRWFESRPFVLDEFIDDNYPDDREDFYKIFSLDRCIMKTAKEMRMAGGNLSKIFKYYCTNTIIGMRRFCLENDGVWIDVTEGDSIYRMSWFHYVIANELERSCKKWLRGNNGETILVSVPPQHCKSSLIAGGLAPMMMGLRPATKGIITTYSSNFGAEILRRDTMNIISSSGYGILYGKVFQSSMTERDKAELNKHGIKKLMNNANRKVTLKNGSLFAGSMKQATGNDANFLIVDDPIPSMEVARSDSEVQKITDEFNASAGSRVRNGTFLAIVHTRWRAIDLIGSLLTRRENMSDEEKAIDPVINIVFRAWYDPTDEFEYDFRTYKDELLWEEVSLKAYTKAKYSDVLTRNALYQQKPIDDNISFISKEWIKRFDISMIDTIGFDRKVISIDTSYNDTITSDKCAIGVYGVKDNNYYLIDLFYDIASFTRTIEVADKMILKHNDYFSILVELKANGRAVIEVLEKRYSRVIKIDPLESKKARLLSVSPIIESGRLWLPNDAMGDDVLEQIVNFKGVSKREKDDLVDITTQCMRFYDKMFNIGDFNPGGIKFYAQTSTNSVDKSNHMQYNKSIKPKQNYIKGL